MACERKEGNARCLSNWPEGGFITEKVSLGAELGLGGGQRIGAIQVRNAE